ncbi:chloramphenicol phosphotransferase [Kaistia dalseonensis]|uniref:Chloramphenicol 3-O phosphotransferase n=1 Tax=Kaistia dalseonensis TaxID=410840 RepID=A0ABU0H882_9HYPH|nr:chloramphenicol phosphotransferase [Kaistia dalseonensis]MCX5495497.1 chloramphenicol phosphotransferase [Kaistia dalseonensis]MDQ0438088.1 chloramphenicol 3-O phosphotransferase [Kaistia dalseonensis]
MSEIKAGRIVVLNGAPRSGKSSIVAALQAREDAVWVNFGVDMHNAAMLPPRLRPGIGLRPGGEMPGLEVLLPRLYAGLYESIAAHSRLGFDVVADLGHHDDYSQPLGILADCARRLHGLPALLVGVHCPLDTIMARRRVPVAGREGLYAADGEDGAIPAPVRRWQEAVHAHQAYDLELDTSLMSPEACAEAILARLAAGQAGPSAFERLERGI